MKRILIYLFVLFSISAGAQTTTTTQWQGAPLTKIINRGVLQVDTAFLSPIRDTTFNPVRVGVIVFREADLSLYVSIALTGKKWEKIGAAGSAGAWGTITGTLSSQTDLQAALDAKQDEITLGTSSQYLKGDLSLGTFSTDVRAVGDAAYSQLGHTHTASQVTDLTSTVRNLFSAGTGLSYNASTGQFSFSGGGSGTYLFSAPLSEAGGAVSITQANSSTNGYLSAADYQRFFAKTDSIKVRNDSLFEYKNGTEYARGKISATVDSFTYATRRYVDSSVSAKPTLYTANGTLSGNRTVTMGSYGLNFYKDASNYANLTSTTIDMRRGKLYLYGDNTFGQMRLRTSGFEYNAWNNVYENNDSSFTAGIYSSNENTYNWKQAQFEANWQDGAAWKVAAYWKTNSTISGMKGWTLRHTTTDGQAEIYTDRETFTVGSSGDSALVRKSDGTLGLYPVSGGGGASLSTTDNNLTISGSALSTKKTTLSLTDGATISWDMSQGYNAEVVLAGNRTLSITNAQNGQYGLIIVKQDATGGRTLLLPGNSEVINGGAGNVTLSTTGNAIDILTFFYDGATFYWTIGKNYN